MDRLRLGRSLRALRIRRGLRQEDVAARSGTSRSQVARIERGEIDRARLADVVLICEALGADLDVRLRWRGEALDRLLDAGHAALVKQVVRMLASAGWQCAVEASFSVYGERGSIDVLGWQPDAAVLLVVEVKTSIADAQGTIATHDRKIRLGRTIARERGWEPKFVGGLLVVVDRSVTRRRIATVAELFQVAYPDRIATVRRWLPAPAGRLSGLIFLAYDPEDGVIAATAGRERVRRPGSGRARAE